MKDLITQLIKRIRKEKLKKKQMTMKYQIENIPLSNNNNCQIYGGIYLDFNLMREGDNPMRISSNRKVIYSEYFKNSGFIVLRFENETNQNQDIKKAIHIAESINDQSIFHEIAVNLRQYQHMIVDIKQQKQKLIDIIQNNKCLRKYHELYQQFEQYAMNEIKLLDGKKLFFSFNIYKFSLKCLELSSQLNGYSSALLKLRGVFSEDPSLAFNKNTYYFFTKETCLEYVLNLLKKTVFQSKISSTTPYLLTFDELKIPFKSKSIILSNRDSTYPYYHDQIDYGMQQNYVEHPEKKQSSKIVPEFFLNIRFYEFDSADLKTVQEIRKGKSKFDNLLYSNLDSQIQVLEFVDKFYKNDHHSIEGMRTNKCGIGCCGDQKEDIFLQKKQ